MNLKSIVLSGALALISTSFVAAQNNDKVSIGVRAGLTIPSLQGGSGNPLSEGYSSVTRFGAGVFADFRISQLFSIQPMLEYAEEGAKRNGMQALQASGQPAPYDYIYADINSKAKMNYLMLPVLAKFGWDFGQTKQWRFYFDVGPYAGLLMSAKQVISNPSNSIMYMDANGTIPMLLDQTDMSSVVVVPGGTTDIKEQLHKANWGFEGNVGIQYQIKRSKIFLEAGGNYGMMNIQKNTSDGQWDNGKNHIGAATVMVGYAYAL